MDYRRLLRWFFDPLVVIGALFFGFSLLAATLALLWLTRSPAPAAGVPTAALTVIPYPTETPLPPTATQASATSPTPSPLPPPPPGNISVGAYVQIAGTGGDGLRLRVEPGLSSDVRMLGLESEVFEVRDGPRQADGYTWWFLVTPLDQARSGWAVANYLARVQSP